MKEHNERRREADEGKKKKMKTEIEAIPSFYVFSHDLSNALEEMNYVPAREPTVSTRSLAQTVVEMKTLQSTRLTGGI